MPEIVKKRPLGHPKSKTKFTNYLIYNTLEKSTFSPVFRKWDTQGSFE